MKARACVCTLRFRLALATDGRLSPWHFGPTTRFRPCQTRTYSSRIACRCKLTRNRTQTSTITLILSAVDQLHSFSRRTIPGCKRTERVYSNSDLNLDEIDWRLSRNSSRRRPYLGATRSARVQWAHRHIFQGWSRSLLDVLHSNLKVRWSIPPYNGSAAPRPHASCALMLTPDPFPLAKSRRDDPPSSLTIFLRLCTIATPTADATTATPRGRRRAISARILSGFRLQRTPAELLPASQIRLPVKITEGVGREIGRAHV